LQKTLANGIVPDQMHRVRDGIEAMQYLRQEKPFEDAVRPDLILLDLNMPRFDGRGVLRKCSQEDELKSIPIVVFTSSDDDRDVLESYQFKASSYITKPVDLLQFREVIAKLSDYWFCVASLPNQNRAVPTL